MTIHDLLADIALARIQNPTAKIVLLSIASYSNGAGECWPSRETISRDTCVPLRSVVRAIQWLEEHGYIRIQPRTGSSNFYIITCMEEEMSDDTRATVAHEVDSNITKLDISKKRNTSSRATVAHPKDTPFFLAFWQAYPRRVGKGAARIAFDRAIRSADPNEIVQAAIAYSQHCQEMGIEMKFRPHPATWLNGERWEDDLEAEKQDVKQVKNHDWLNEL
jgi:DNA-binding transcriptional regulator YhcF (GntR family)